MIDSQHAIAHNKVIVIDGETVITGSFNFTKAAEERNAENLLVIDDAVVARQYLKNWMIHAAHSQFVGAHQSSVVVSPTENKSEAKADAADAGQIVGNKRSHIYAWRGCGSYDAMSPQNRIVFPNRAAAEAAGYRAARNCSR